MSRFKSNDYRELAIDLFKNHICGSRYVGCEVCAIWYLFTDKHNMTDIYPTQKSWAEYCDYCRGDPEADVCECYKIS